MASDQDFVDFACDQMSGAGIVWARKMFGEYALYLDGKVIALVCDNQLFVKPTDGGRAFIGRVTEGSPYPGAKPQFLVTEQLDDRDWISQLIRITHAELPLPKAKTPRKTQKASHA